jgi:hypothetical protein
VQCLRPREKQLPLMQKIKLPYSLAATFLIPPAYNVRNITALSAARKIRASAHRKEARPRRRHSIGYRLSLASRN